MKVLLVYIYLLSLLGAHNFNDPVGSLKVRFEGLIEHTGKLAIVLLDERGTQVSEYWIPVNDSSEVLEIETLEPGNYIVKFFHDVNNNGEMDTNWAGIPKESFGFSNNGHVLLGPPPLKEMVFTVEGMTEIVIRAKHL